MADLDNYLPLGAETKNYADDIISYIIGTNTTTELPQQITDAVQLCCLDNRMCLNSESCNLRLTRPIYLYQLCFGLKTLAVVDCDKSLGFQVSNSAMSSQPQLDHFYSQITSNYLT